VISSTFSPEVAEDDLCNQINNLTWGWHILRRRELKVPSSESLEMLATLLFKKVQQHFRARHYPVIPDLTHSDWQKF
jgi:hypothetical protein